MSYTRAYHYTTFPGAVGIINERVINLSVPPEGSGKLTATWFSTNPQWDAGMGTVLTNPSGGRSEIFTKQRIAKQMGLIRFVTDAQVLIPFAELRQRGIITPELELRYLQAKANGADPISDWHVLLSPLPLKYVTGAEIYERGQWLQLTPERLQRLDRSLPNRGFTTVEQVFSKRRKPKRRKRKR